MGTGAGSGIGRAPGSLQCLLSWAWMTLARVELAQLDAHVRPKTVSLPGICVRGPLLSGPSWRAYFDGGDSETKMGLESENQALNSQPWAK